MTSFIGILNLTPKIMNKNYWIFLLLIGLTACKSDDDLSNSNNEPTCNICDDIPGTYATSVTYTEWEALYDSDGEFVIWEYYENLSQTNEVEIILTDYETASFQLNGLYKSFLVDIPASFNDETDRLEFEHEITRSGNNYRILKGSVRLSNDSLFIESNLLEHGHYFPGTETFESFASEVGERM